MQLRLLTQFAGGLLLALTLAACANSGSQSPTIIAATEVQGEPTAAPAVEAAPPATTAATEAAPDGGVAVEPPAEAAAGAPAAEPAAAEPAPAPQEDAAAAADQTSAAPLPDAAPPDAPAEPAPSPGDSGEAAAEAAESGDGAPPADIGSEGARDAQTATAAAEPARAAAEQAERAEPPVTVAVAAATPSAFVDSYRLSARFKIVSNNASGVVADTDVAAEGAWRRADNAFGFDASFRMETVNNGAAQVIEYVMLGDRVALRTGDGWTVSPRGGELPIGEPVAMLDVPFAGALALGPAVGAEEIGGVLTTHYRIDNAEQFAALVADAFGGRAGTLTSITLDSWLADDGYVVQYLLAATASGATVQDSTGADQTVDQTIAVEYALRDINAVEDIAWPGDAPPADALVVPGFDANAFPLPPDAQMQPTVGVLAYDTTLDETAVRDFYAAQLGAAGWSLEGEYGYYTARRGEEAIVIAVTAGEGVTRVEVFGQ